MTNIKIAIPDVTTRTWKNMKDIQQVFTDEQIVTIVHRYCDSQDHAKNYRVNAAARVKAMKARLEELGEIV